VDWFWEFPGLTLPALAWLALAGNPSLAPRGARRVRHRARIGAAVAIVLAAGVATLPAWLAVKEIDAARATWAADADGALDRLDRARRLNPLTDEADLVAGAIAGRRGDLETMTTAFQRALERNRTSWFARLELGLVAAAGGRRDDATRWIGEALARNPQEPILREVLTDLQNGRSVDRAAIERRLIERAEARAR
jgi:tetratricopeptide (TPR) repeat protein